MVEEIIHDEHHEAGSEKKDGLVNTSDLEEFKSVEEEVIIDKTKSKVDRTKESLSPTVEGINQAVKDLVQALQDQDENVVRQIILRLEAYAVTGLVSTSLLSSPEISSLSDIPLESMTMAQRYALGLYLHRSGYLSQKNFDDYFAFSPILDTGEAFRNNTILAQNDVLSPALVKLSNYETTYSRYQKEYLKPSFTYQNNEALYTTLVDFTMHGSKEQLSGRLASAKSAPIIKNLLKTQGHIKQLNDIMDDNPNNDLAEKMFLYLYILADGAYIDLQLKDEKNVLPVVTISAEKKDGVVLPSLDTNSIHLVKNPGKNYDIAILLSANGYLDNQKNTSEAKDYETQLAEVNLMIDRLIKASDTSDPEKQGENVDQYLVNAVEEKIDALAKPSYDKMKNLNVKDIVDIQTRVQKLVELYVEKFLFNHSVSHSQLLWALSCLPLEKKMDYLTKLSDRALHLNVIDREEEAIVEKDSPPSSMGLGYSRELGYGTYIDPEQLDSLLSQDNSMFTNVDQLLAAHKAFVLNLRANLSFTGNGIQHKIPLLGFRPRWQMMPARSEQEKNSGLLDVQKNRYEEVLGNVTQDTLLSKIDSLDAYFEEVSGGVLTTEEDKKISNMLDPRTQMIEVVNQKISALLIEQYKNAPDEKKDEIANKILEFIGFICPEESISNKVSIDKNYVADYGTATQLTDFLLDERGLVELKNEDEPILSQEEEKKWQQTYFSEKGLDITQIENKSLGDLFVSRRDVQPKDASITETGLFDIKISSIPHEERPMVYALALALQNSPTGGDEEISRGLVDIIQEYMGSYGMHVYMYAREHAKIAYKKTGLRDIDKKIIKSHKNIWGISENGKDGGYKIGDNNPHMLMINLSLFSKISGWFLKFLTKSYRKKNRRKWALGGAGVAATNGLLSRYTNINIFGVIKGGGKVLWRLLKLIGEGVGIHIKDSDDKNELEIPVQPGETKWMEVINALKVITMSATFNNNISITDSSLKELGWVTTKTKRYQLTGTVDIGFDISEEGLKTLIPNLDPDKNGVVMINLPAPYIKVGTADLQCVKTAGLGVGVKDANTKFESQANGRGQYFAFAAARDPGQKAEKVSLKFEGDKNKEESITPSNGIDMVQLAKNTFKNKIKAIYGDKVKEVRVEFKPGIDEANSSRFETVQYKDTNYPRQTITKGGEIPKDNVLVKG